MVADSAGAADLPRLLLICPEFFSYHRDISARVEGLGYHVVWWNDRPSSAALYKLALRLFPRLMAPLTRRHYAARLRALERPGRFEHVLVVKGESLSTGTITALRTALPNARFTYYTWDGIANVRGAMAIVPMFDAAATFDPVDARQFGWAHRPLFARTIATGSEEGRRCYDWAFIGTLHSDRYRVLRRLARGNATARFYAFLYIPGRLMWILRHLTNWQLWSPGDIRVSLTPLSAEESRRATMLARAIVDVEHPRQRGLTMRTIETLMSGEKLVTTNACIYQSDLYHPSRVCVIDRRAPTVPAGFLASPVASLTSETRARYSIDGWLEDLLENRPGAGSAPVPPTESR